MGSITVSMIVKNEEQYLKTCLESVRPFAAEIVIVDTGSTDSTKEIAAAFDTKIYDFQWINDFSAARNESLRHATGDWILYLDADEEITPDSVEELKEIAAKDERLGVWVTLRSIDEKNRRPNLMRYLRFFRNHPELRFRGRVHEQIIDSLEKLNYSFYQSSITILHHGYNVSAETMKQKAGRNLELLLDDYLESPTAYIAFQLGQTFGVLKDKTNAVQYFEKSLEQGYLASHYRAMAYRFLAAHALEKEQIEEAKKLIEKALIENDEQPIVNFIAAKVYLKLEDVNKGVLYCRRAYQINHDLLTGKKISEFDTLVDEEELIYSGMELALTYGLHDLFHYFFDRLKEYPGKITAGFQAEADLLQKLLSRENLSDAEKEQFLKVIGEKNLSTYIKLLQSHPDTQMQKELYEKALPRFAGNSRFLESYGALLLSMPEMEKAANIFEQSVKAEPENPVSYFYLISVYIQTGKAEKARKLVENALATFKEQSSVRERLLLVKKKIELL